MKFKTHEVKFKTRVIIAGNRPDTQPAFKDLIKANLHLQEIVQSRVDLLLRTCTQAVVEANQHYMNLSAKAMNVPLVNTTVPYKRPARGNAVRSAIAEGLEFA